MDENNNIAHFPNVNDREFFRVNGSLYMFCETIDSYKPSDNEHQGFFIPTFAQDEDDFVGLSIDAFREQVMIENPPGKDGLLQVQQLMSMMKRFFDAEVLGRKQKLYKKIKVNISGSGLAFPSDVAYHTGQLLKAALFFPRFPYTYLNVVVEVVRSEKADIGYEIKVHYKDITEKTRDEILKFVNQCQRDTLHNKETS